MPMTRILAFSDLSWGTREKEASGGQVEIGSFLRLVEEADPDIVVFTGDAAYDRCSHSGLDETELFLGLLRQIAVAGKHCVVVEGNNDDTMGTYGRVRDVAAASPYIHEVSGEVRVVCGIRFLGVPTGKEKRMAESTCDAVDIVVVHAPYANRIWLFDLPAACIVTGHYGMMGGRSRRKGVYRPRLLPGLVCCDRPGGRSGSGSSTSPGRAGSSCAAGRGSPRPAATRHSSGI